MAFKIELKSTKIPIEIGAFKFEVDMTDTKRKELEESIKKFAKVADQLDEKNPEDEAKLKEMLGNIFDELFGSGTFKKLYAHTESLEIWSNVLAHTISGIREAIVDRATQRPKLEKLGLKQSEKPKSTKKTTGKK